MQKTKTPSLVSVTYGMLTSGQQKEAAKQGFVRNAQSVKSTSVISVPLGMLNKQQQAQLLQGATPTKARTGKTGKWRRRDRSKAATANQFAAPSQAGSATVQSETKIADYNLRGLPIKLVYGNGQQVARHLRTLPNKTAIAMIAVDDVKTYANGKFPWAAALYVDGFVQNFENAKQVIPRDFVDGIIKTLNEKSVMKKVSYLNFIATFSNGVRHCDASLALKGTPAVRSFLNALWPSVFGKDGTVLGTSGTEQTNVVFLLGDNGPRTGYDWIGESFSLAPSAFPEQKQPTRHLVGRDYIAEFIPGTEQIKAVTAQKKWDAIHTCSSADMNDVKIAGKLDGKLADFSVVTTTGKYGDVAVATLEGGKSGFMPFSIDLGNDQITLKAIDGLGVPNEVVRKMGGWLERISPTGLTLVSPKGENIVSRLPASYAPTEVKHMMEGLYEPQQAAA